jgi:hypothetical protein
MTTHTHRTESSRTIPFTGPVATERQNPRAHGGVTEIATCKCGATRLTNRNQGHVERGQWQTND